MSDIHERITNLSAAKRRLLRMMLEEEGAHTPPVRPAPQRRQAGPSPGTDAAETKRVIRHYYDSISEQLDASIFGEHALFLNYGYVPGDDDAQFSRIELPKYCLNKNSIKLTLEVIGDCDLTALDVLDVGSGRGGTVRTISRYFGARRIVGLDLSASAVSFCRAKQDASHTHFLQGDAERLPFRDESFDIVINIESSHNYTDIRGFYEEVRRVLRDRGRFLYADNLPAASLEGHLDFLRGAGFAVEQDRDITANVLLSCDEAARRRFAAFQVERDEEGLLNNFVAAPGSQIYEDMKRGASSYRIFKLRKQSGRRFVSS